MKREIIKQYVATLKEDGELDYIFPLLLERMGYRVLMAPKQSKGQPQYGKDVVALKIIKGVTTLYHFELKGFAAKDITDRTLNETDGIIESLRASKYTDYTDYSIPGLNTFPKYYVFVHNGSAEPNALNTLNGFVKKEFPEGNFIRWDLEILTSHFSEYLYDETLLVDEESYRLFKKALVLLDAEGNDFSDIVRLVELQITKIDSSSKGNRRLQLNFFATLRLIASMVYFYSKESDNIYPAKYCIDTIVLKTWAWILRNMYEKKAGVIKHFNSLVLLQVQIYEEYINKILRFANLNKGLYSFEGSDTEYIFYPLRCYDFLGDLVYYYILLEAYGLGDEHASCVRMRALKDLIRNNSACTNPLLDTHSIPIMMVFKYMAIHETCQDDIDCLGRFLLDTVLNLCSRYNKQKMWPEMSGNRFALAKSLYEKSDNYCCESSLLILDLFEMMVHMGMTELYLEFKRKVEESGINLQVAYPLQKQYDIEANLFEHRLNDEITVETNIRLPDTLDDFKSVYKKKYASIKYRTDAVNYGFLRILAHKYYETDFFPDYLDRTFCKD